MFPPLLQGFCPKSCRRWRGSWCCDRAGSGVPLAWSRAVFGLPEGQAWTRQEVGPGSWSLVCTKTRGEASKNCFTENGCQQLRGLCSGEQSEGGVLGPGALVAHGGPSCPCPWAGLWGSVAGAPCQDGRRAGRSAVPAFPPVGLPRAFSFLPAPHPRGGQGHSEQWPIQTW